MLRRKTQCVLGATHLHPMSVCKCGRRFLVQIVYDFCCEGSTPPPDDLQTGLQLSQLSVGKCRKGMGLSLFDLALCVHSGSGTPLGLSGSCCGQTWSYCLARQAGTSVALFQDKRDPAALHEIAM